MTDRERRRIWIALSDLWLDTEHTPETLRRIARALRATGYDWPDIDRICRTEVAPVMGANLQGPAGEWAGVDADWLEARIGDHKRSVRRRLIAPLVRRHAMKSIRDDWRQVADQFAALADEQSASTD